MAVYAWSCFLLFLVVPMSTIAPPFNHIPLNAKDPDPYNLDLFHRVPSIAFQEQNIINALAPIPGYKILSAILSHRDDFWNTSCLGDLILHPPMFRLKNHPNDTRVFLPFCDGVTYYFRRLDDENHILDKNPTLLEDLVEGRRKVVRICVDIERFEGNISNIVADPLIYRNESERVYVHGVAAGGFGSHFKFVYGDHHHDDQAIKIEAVIISKHYEDKPDWRMHIAYLCTFTVRLPAYSLISYV